MSFCSTCGKNKTIHFKEEFDEKTGKQLSFERCDHCYEKQTEIESKQERKRVIGILLLLLIMFISLFVPFIVDTEKCHPIAVIFVSYLFFLVFSDKYNTTYNYFIFTGEPMDSGGGD